MKHMITILIFTITTHTFYGQFIYSSNQSSQVPMRDSAVMIKAAGPEYAASGWKEFWWGKHYRREWATPVLFPVLHIENFEGGLTPLKIGGGHESKSLRLLSASGREYVLRTSDRTHDAVIPAELKGTFLNDIVNDQVSTAHPYGAIAISRMAEAISILHTNPRVYYVADDPALGEYRKIFGNNLALLEERLSGKGWKHDEHFGDADEILNWRQTAPELFASTKNAVNQEMFLRVRLFDMIINDWDRHEDQWVWAVKKKAQEKEFLPIARDRDQAFSRADGTAVYLASRPWAFRPLKNFDSRVKDLKGQNFSARNLDRNFLNSLTKDDWREAIHYIQAHLTDSAIQNAVYAMPAEVNEISGAYLVKRLQQRTSNLSDYGMKYYSLLNKRVTITGAAENEKFIIDAGKKNQVSVTGLRPGSDTFYHRVFYRNQTKEINIYALDGDDEYMVKGNNRNRFKIRFIGGQGNNNYLQENDSLKGKKIRIYDSLKIAVGTTGSFRVNHHWDSLYNYNYSSPSYNWYLPLIFPGYNPDDGLTLAFGILYKKRQWGKSPFGWQQQFTVDYATGTSAAGFGYRGIFNISKKWNLDLNSFYKGPRYTLNYYGLGNETELNGHKREFFRVKANDFYVSPGISRSWKFNYLRFGLQYETVKILPSHDKFFMTSQAMLDTRLFNANQFGGVGVRWDFFNAGDEHYPGNGFHFTSDVFYLDDLNDTRRDHLNISGSAAAYHRFGKNITLAHRTGGGTIFGDFNFYQANTLGGNENLRGFWRDRFAGRSSFYQNTELRYKAFDLKGYVFRGRLGLFSFFDDGRVWIKDENSSRVHVGYGGGVFFAPYNLYTFNLYYATSKEANIITLKAGFLF